MNRPLDHHQLSQVTPDICFTSGTNGATTRNFAGIIFQGLQTPLQSLTTAPSTPKQLARQFDRDYMNNSLKTC